MRRTPLNADHTRPHGSDGSPLDLESWAHSYAYNEDGTLVGAGRVVVDALVPNVSVDVPGVYKGKAIFGPLQITEPSANIDAPSSFYLRIGGDSMTPYKIGLSFPNAVKL